MQDRVKFFESFSRQLEADTGGPVHLIRIIGPRSSFVAGRVPQEMPFVEPVRVMLDDTWGLVFYPAAGRKIDQDKIKAMFKGEL